MKPALGVCYYPEHWPRDMWERDAARMVEVGIKWVRIGEFAWSKIEPRPDEFHWGWLDDAIDVLGAAGLRVVLGTPTATPPRWMADKHPDMFALDAQGHLRGFGSRRHYCFSNDGYRAEACRITKIIAQRYAQNPHIAAWQIDNEYDCHDTAISYSPHAQRAFGLWCAERYGDIGALNEKWGNVFWSMEYNDFDQIGLPNLTVTEPNPAHVLAFRRFSSDQVVRFNGAACDIIRDYSGKPLIHNFMGRITAFDHHAVGADLDISSWDSYPMGFLLDRVGATDAEKKHYLRQGDPDFQAFHHDLYRGTSAGRMWVMEQQPGPVNWAPWNPAPLQGMPRSWAWEAFAHGAEVVCYFRWRQAPFGQEQLHAGLLRPDDQPAPAYEDALQVAQELAAQGDMPPAAADVAIIFDYESAFAWEAQPQGADFDYFQLVFDLYRAMRRLGLMIDIIPKTADPDDYKLVFAPALFTVPENLTNAKTARVVFGPRTGQRGDDFSIPHQCPNIAGLDVTLGYVESLPPFAPMPVAGGGAFEKWRESFSTTEQVLMELPGGNLAMVQAGQLYYIGGLPNAALWQRIITDLAQAADVPVTPLPSDLRQRDTKTHRFWFNHGPDAVEWQGIRIPPAGVVWNEL